MGLGFDEICFVSDEWGDREIKNCCLFTVKYFSRFNTLSLYAKHFILYMRGSKAKKNNPNKEFRFFDFFKLVLKRHNGVKLLSIE